MNDGSKTSLPGGIVGNGRMLCSITDTGELARLFWPSVSWGQHMGVLKTGLFEDGRVLWLDNSSFQSSQSYEHGSNILVTLLRHGDHQLEITLEDMVLPEHDILARMYTVKNTDGRTRSINLSLYCSFNIDESDTQDGMYYLPREYALVQYRRGIFLGMRCQGRDPYGINCGRRHTPSDPWDPLNRGDFWGTLDNIKNGACALGWQLGSLQPGESVSFTLLVAAANSEAGLADLFGLAVLDNPAGIKEEVNMSCKAWLKGLSRDISCGGAHIARSLLAIKLMTDRTSCSTVAAPEFDSRYVASGGYGYCWPRDNMYVAMAMDEAGFHDEAAGFYRFAARVQDRDGSWHQRFFTDGAWAPGWGRQIDQAGAVLWGYDHHYRVTGDKSFLDQIWPSVVLGADYLLGNIASNGLPRASMDIWEDEFSQSTYASAAVFGGLAGASRIARAMGKPELQSRWDVASELLKNSILGIHWSEDTGCFTRSVNRRVCHNEYCSARDLDVDARTLQIPGTPYTYYTVGRDNRLDAAMLGLCFPFGVLPAGHEKMSRTAQRIVESLTNNHVGGLHRYQGDSYAGGNPWVLASMWMSVYFSLKGIKDLAAGYLDWVRNNSSQAGLLPEQVHRDRGGPAWVLPLSWSHAFYILASLALEGKLSLQRSDYNELPNP